MSREAEKKLKAKLKSAQALTKSLEAKFTNLSELANKCAKDTALHERFLNETENIDLLREEFKNAVIQSNETGLELDEAFEPSYDSLMSVDTYHSLIQRVRSNVMPKANTTESINTSSTSNENTNTVNKSVHIKLPAIDIPYFDGKIENWSIFYQSFKVNIHENKQLTDSQRVQYLVGKLKGNALTSIGGILPTEENYNTIWKNLVTDYQDKRALATRYLNNIFDIKFTSKNPSQLSSFVNKFTASVSALKQLEIPDISDFCFLNCALKKVDPEIVQQYELSVRSQEFPTCQSFLDFMRFQAKVLERIGVSSSHHPHKPIKNTRSYLITDNSNKLNNKNDTEMSNNTNSDPCIFCKETNHNRLYICPKFKGLSVQDRFNFVKSKHGCINCLSTNHSTIKCLARRTCNICKQKHHFLLHFEKVIPNQTNVKNEKNDTHCHMINIDNQSETEINDNENTHCHMSKFDRNNKYVLLSTAQVLVKTENNSYKPVKCLIDNGSQNNIITVDCCKRLKLKIIPLINSNIKGIGSTVRPVHGYVNIRIKSRVSSNQYTINALVVDNITDKLPSYEIDICQHTNLKDLSLADPTWYLPSTIDLILGAQLFPSIFLSDYKGSNPTALSTTFGYILTGEINKSTLKTQSCQSFCSFVSPSNNEIESCMHKFWELEEIPSKLIDSKENVDCEKLYTESVERNANGRYIVNLPFERNPNLLGNSRAIAERRLLFLEKKFKLSKELRNQYNDIITEYLQKGYLEEIIDDGEGYYIPHHAVIREDRLTTKVRIVLDASAKTHSGLSLNDILYAGPNLQTNLFHLLIKFRLFPYALTADIKQMYLQVGMTKSHRKFQKILYRFNEHELIRTFQFTTVSFGIKSSPFLAMRTIRQLANDERHIYPEAAKHAECDLYMDDFVTSILTYKKASSTIQQSINLFAAGGFDLVKWTSNCTSLTDNLPKSHKSSIDLSLNEQLKILGLSWNPNSDTYTFITSKPKTSNCTKRIILSTVAKLFDVLGFVSPVILYAKLLIKELWNAGIGWDEVPPSHIITKYKKLMDEFPLLAKLRIPRHVGIFENCDVNLIAFCDASQQAYGCVIYLQIINHKRKIETQLLCAKSKIAPVKTTTLARLELSAAVLLSKLVRNVYNIIQPRYPIHKIFAFTDSMITLSWIKSSPHRWSIFVSNRIAQIHENLSPECFYHVSGKENPSDCISRGLLPSQMLKQELWWEGPTWIKGPTKDWPIKLINPLPHENLPEFNTKSFHLTNTNKSILYEMSLRVSTWNKLLKTIVFILKFIRKSPPGKQISVSDMNLAETFIIKVIQHIHFNEEIEQLKNNQPITKNKYISKLSPFIDKNGIVRIGGRLSNSNLTFEAQHPVLLPKRDHTVNLIIDHYHIKNCHAGADLLLSIIRQRFWILAARSSIRKRIRQCNNCFKLTPVNVPPKMADLPESRVCESKSFLHTGVDFAGPIKITLSRRKGQHSQKAYICLFVCLAVKAVHIELVPDLTVNSFINAFKRFVARRGPVSCLYSDNATTFIGAKNKINELYEFLQAKTFRDSLTRELNNQRIEWKTIPPHSPNFGGLWESNIKSCKKHLYRVIGTQLITYEELTTLLTQIEAILNSRPLCTISAEPNLEILTPAHFLMSTPLQQLPAYDASVKPNLITRKKLLDSLISSYWSKWRLEYLNTLQIRQKWFKHNNPLKVGQVVIVNELNTVPMQWPLGIIEQIYCGKDDIARVALVKTKFGSFKRPVTKLFPLPNQ